VAAGNDRNVNLVISARNEADRAIQQVSNALNSLFSNQEKVAGSATGMASTLAAVDKAFATISSAADKGAAAFERQQATLARTKDDYQALVAQANNAAVALENLKTKQAQIGPQIGGPAQLATQVKLVEQEYGRLVTQASKLSNAIARQENQSVSARSALQQLGSTAIAAEESQGRLRAEIELQTLAIEEQAAAAKELTDIQRKINQATGVDKQSAGRAADVAELLAAADARYREAEGARVVNVQLAERARLEQALERFTGLGRLKATDAGASFSALDEQARAEAAAASAAETEAAAARKAADAARERATAERTLISNLAERAQLERALEQHTGLGRLKATDAGATFSALEEQARAEAAAADAADVEAATAKKAAGATRDRADAERVLIAQLAERAQIERALEQNTGLGRAKATDAGATFSALDEQARAAEAAALAEGELDAAVAKLRTDMNPLVEIQERHNRALAEARALQAAGKISADELTKAEAHLAAEAARAAQQLENQGKSGKLSAFGLKPYELQNLGYQVNDVVTQIASGTSISQTFAQQGGQILQLFPKVGAAIIAAFTNPAFLGAAVVFGAIALGAKHAADEAEHLREIQSGLAGTENGALYDASKLNESVDALRLYGVAADDAVAGIKTLAGQLGVSQTQIEAFIKTSKDFSDTTGTKMAEAVKQVGKAFTGSFESIVELDRATNTYTASELELIQSLFAHGRADEARAQAFKIFSDRQDEAAAKARGPWGEAARSLGQAWQSLMQWLGDTIAVKFTIAVLDALANAVKRVGDVISSALGTTTADRVKGLRTEIQTLKDSIKELESDNGRLAKNPHAKYLVDLNDRSLAEARQQLAEAEKKLADAQQTPAAGAGTGPIKESDADFKAATLLKGQRDKEHELQDLRERGQKSVDQLRVRNEQFMSAAEQRRRVALAGELAALKEMGDVRLQQQARADAQDNERKKIQSEQDAFVKAQQSPQIQARQFIIGREGYRSSAYLDSDNRYRVGFGSSTTTGADGSVGTVSKGTTVNLEGAIRDLDRRIGEFQSAIKTNIGADRFNSFSPQQQAAVTSIAYNYGHLPERIVEALRHGTAAEIATAIRGLGGDRAGNLGAGANRGRRNLEASTFEQANVALGANTQKQAEDLAADQNAFNDQIDRGNAALKQRTDELTRQAGLQGEALLLAQAQAAADEAERRLRDSFEKTNDERLKARKEALKLSEAEVAATRAAASAAVLTPQASTRAQLDDLQRKVTDRTAERDSVRALADEMKSIGDTTGAEKLTDSLGGINEQLIKAIENLQAFYDGLTDVKKADLHLTAEQMEAITDQLKKAKLASQEWGDIMVGSVALGGREVANVFASTVTSAFDKFAKSVASGANVFKAAKHAFLDFAASFLREIAQMIIKQLALAAASAILKSFGVSVPVPTHHGGGVAGGAPTSTKSVSPALFLGAMRYHEGGVAGLAPGEVPAILKEGERIRTVEQEASLQRELAAGRNRGGGSSGSATVINVFDPADALERALRSPTGEKVLINHVRENQGAFKAALG
jgi:GH24 family phage-related lysozyme (muramidase)